MPTIDTTQAVDALSGLSKREGIIAVIAVVLVAASMALIYLQFNNAAQTNRETLDYLRQAITAKDQEIQTRNDYIQTKMQQTLADNTEALHELSTAIREISK